MPSGGLLSVVPVSALVRVHWSGCICSGCVTQNLILQILNAGAVGIYNRIIGRAIKRTPDEGRVWIVEWIDRPVQITCADIPIHGADFVEGNFGGRVDGAGTCQTRISVGLIKIDVASVNRNPRDGVRPAG